MWFLIWKEKCIHNAPLKKLTVAASASLIVSRDLKENFQTNLDSLTINYIRPSEAELNYSRADYTNKEAINEYRP